MNQLNRGEVRLTDDIEPLGKREREEDNQRESLAADDGRRIERSGLVVDSKWVGQSQRIGLLGLWQQAYQLTQSLH